MVRGPGFFSVKRMGSHLSLQPADPQESAQLNSFIFDFLNADGCRSIMRLFLPKHVVRCSLVVANKSQEFFHAISQIEISRAILHKTKGEKDDRRVTRWVWGCPPPSWLSGKASTPKAARLGNDGRGHSACHFPAVGGRMQHTLALRESQITTSKLIQVMWIRNLTELHNVCCHSNLAAEMVCKCHCNHIQSHTECRGRSSCRAHFSRFLDLGGLVRWL